MPRPLKSSGKRCSGGTRRSRGPSFDCKRQQKPVVLSMRLRKPGEKQRPRKRPRGRGLWRRRRGRRGQGSTSSDSGTRC